MCVDVVFKSKYKNIAESLRFRHGEEFSNFQLGNSNFERNQLLFKDQDAFLLNVRAGHFSGPIMLNIMNYIITRNSPEVQRKIICFILKARFLKWLIRFRANIFQPYLCSHYKQTQSASIFRPSSVRRSYYLWFSRRLAVFRTFGTREPDCCPVRVSVNMEWIKTHLKYLHSLRGPAWNTIP